MTKAHTALLLLGVSAAGFIAGSWYTQRERVSAADLATRRVLYYADPMHPAYRSDKPGTAPDCGMTLVPIYSDSPQNADEHVLSAEKQQLIGVRVAAVDKQSATERLRLYGRVAPDEARLYRINIGIDGVIRELSTATTGSYVRKNEWLATLSAPDARSPIQGFIVAADILERTKKGDEGPGPINLANASLQQSVDRLLTLGMSMAQIEEIARTRQVPPTIKMTAPADGFVVTRNVSVGQKFTRGEELYRLADLRRVWILADVFGREAEYVRPGMSAQVSLAGRGRTFRASISRAVLPQFDPATQSVQVRLDADNPGFLLRPGMFVDVELEISLPPAIAVPADAVLDSGLKKSVFVERRAGVFERTAVETGWRFGDRVEITSGLTPGDRIVTSGTFLLDAESRLRP